MEGSSYSEHNVASTAGAGDNHGWQKVTYAKRRKNQQQKNKDKAKPNGTAALGSAAAIEDGSNVFRAIEEKSEDRRQRIIESQRMAASIEDEPQKNGRSNNWSGDDSDESEMDERRENGVHEEKKDKKKKKKEKKEKKPKISVAEAASKIDASNLAVFLSELPGSYGSQEDVQLMRFADYFGRSFSGVGSAQFPWVKLLKESSVVKMTEIPISHLPDAVYKTSADWIHQRSLEALHSFALWLLDSILADLASQLAISKGHKKGNQQKPSSKSQVAVFVVLAMVLRRKHEVLVSLLPTLKENPKYQGQDKLPIIIWMMSQACQGDLAVGLYSWAHMLLPLLASKYSNSPQSRDLIMQLVERILSAPKARTILINGAVRKGERVIPPSALETLLRLTFPSTHVKATEKFEAVYPTLKEVALVGAPGSKAMRQLSHQILGFAIKAAGESIPGLSKEAAGIFIWCLTQSNDCYKQWDNIYLDNLEASVAILKKLSEEWKGLNLNQSSAEALKNTVKSFRQKNEKAMSEEDTAQLAVLKDADKYCKLILGRLSRGHGCLKGLAVVVVALAVGAVVMSPDVESFDWKRLSVVLSSFRSF